MLLEPRSRLAHAAEDEPLVDAEARDLEQPELVALERLAVALRHRHADEPAGIVIGPGMIRAAKVPAVAGLVLADGRPAMPAAIDEGRHRAVGEPRDNDRMPADSRRLVIAVLGNLRFMADEYPGQVKALIPLHFEDVRIGIDGPMDRIVSNEIFDRKPHQSAPLTCPCRDRRSATPACARRRPLRDAGSAR